MRALTQTIKELGMLNALLYWCGQLLARASHERCGLFRYYFVAQAVQPASAPRAASRFEFILQTEESALLLQSPRPQHVLRQRFAQGAHCLSASLNGQLAAFLWLVPRAYNEDEVRACYLLPSADSGWDFDLWVAPEFRTGLLLIRLWQAAHGLLAQRRQHWTCSRISAFNAASLQLHRRLALQHCGVANFLRLGRWQITLASIPPYLHCSGKPAQAPRFCFDTRKLARPRKDDL